MFVSILQHVSLVYQIMGDTQKRLDKKVPTTLCGLVEFHPVARIRMSTASMIVYADTTHQEIRLSPYVLLLHTSCIVLFTCILCIIVQVLPVVLFNEGDIIFWLHAPAIYVFPVIFEVILVIIGWIYYCERRYYKQWKSKWLCK